MGLGAPYHALCPQSFVLRVRFSGVRAAGALVPPSSAIYTARPLVRPPLGAYQFDRSLEMGADVVISWQPFPYPLPFVLNAVGALTQCTHLGNTHSDLTRYLQPMVRVPVVYQDIENEDLAISG